MTSTDTRHPLRAIAVPAFGPSLLFGLGEGAILPVVPLTARELGASVPEAALVVALIGAGAMLGNIPASMMTMRHGERWTIVGAGLVGAVAMLLCAGTGSLALFASGAFVVGVAQAVFSLARQTYMAAAIPVAYRARAMSTLGGMLRVGFFVGPLLAAAAIHRWGLTAAYVVGATALVVAALVSARLPDLEPSTQDIDPSIVPSRTRWRDVLRDHKPVFLRLGVGVLLLAAVRAARQAVIPLWADHLGLDPSTASLVYGIAAGIEMLVFYPAGRVMDRQGRLAVALPSLAIMGVGLLAVPFTAGVATLLAAAAAIGFGNGLSSGLVMTLGADHAPPAARAQFFGIWRLMTDIGASAGPGLLSLLTAVVSLGAGIAAIGVLAFVAAAQLARWVPRETKPRAARAED